MDKNPPLFYPMGGLNTFKIKWCTCRNTHKPTPLPRTDGRQWRKRGSCGTARPAEPRCDRTLGCTWSTSLDKVPSAQRCQPASDDPTCVFGMRQKQLRRTIGKKNVLAFMLAWDPHATLKSKTFIVLPLCWQIFFSVKEKSNNDAF